MPRLLPQTWDRAKMDVTTAVCAMGARVISRSRGAVTTRSSGPGGSLDSICTKHTIYRQGWSTGRNNSSLCDVALAAHRLAMCTMHAHAS